MSHGQSTLPPGIPKIRGARSRGAQGGVHSSRRPGKRRRTTIGGVMSRKEQKVERERGEARRQFLRWMAASPLLAAPGASELFAQDAIKRADPMIWATTPDTELIKSPKEAINVFDFEAVARQKVPPAHFGYMAS